MTNRLAQAICLLVAMIAVVQGFELARPMGLKPGNGLPGRTRLHMGWADAFKNDASLGKAPNAGLTNGPNYNENVTVNGKKVPGAVVGQKLTVVAGRARVKIPVNCQKGDCGTCVVTLNGRKVKGMSMSSGNMYRCILSDVASPSQMLSFVFPHCDVCQLAKQLCQQERPLLSHNIRNMSHVQKINNIIALQTIQ
jgi:ferredoxin